MNVPLLRAWPHRWGAGLVHEIDEEHDQTRCGKSPGGCPGDKFWGDHDLITCKSCLRSIDAEARRIEDSRQWAAVEAQRQSDEARWWGLYQAYLLTPIWRAKRQRVLERARGWCEGCGEHPAAEVHHKQYPRQFPGVCLPGSPEWLAQEKLFHLVALCRKCHGEVHSRSI